MRGRRRKSGQKRNAAENSGVYWMYGRHACAAALANPARQVQRIVATRNAAEALETDTTRHPAIKMLEGREIEKLVGTDAVHQGVAMLTAPLEPVELDEVLGQVRPLIVLDQVTDPQNTGAILRLAAAFDVAAVVVPRDRSGRESGALAKAASGALELVPWVEVTNLARALEEMQEAGYWVVGMDGVADTAIGEAKLGTKTALVLGAEGKGLRRLSAERCDQLVQIPISARMESLNVSAAEAVGLYVIAENSGENSLM